jgi:hypothetical protein
MSIENVLRGDLENWHGLSGKETREILPDVLKPLRHVHEPVERTRTTQRFMVTIFERAIAPYLIEAWFLYGSQYLALIEYDDPPVQDLEGTLQRYGLPEMTLENKRYVQGAMVKEYIYAHLGITLSLAEPFTTTVEVQRRLVHVQLYSPMSVQRYIIEIGTGPELHPFPRYTEST